VAAATQFDTDGRIGREELQSALRSLNGVRVADATRLAGSSISRRGISR
jgi:hypothetical protein